MHFILVILVLACLGFLIEVAKKILPVILVIWFIILFVRYYQW